MNVSAILEILHALYSGKKVTAAELAATAQCSRRSVYRYLNALTCCGIPICTQSGTGGGIYLYKAV